MQYGLVSTVIPVYNRAVLLRDAVASVLAQTYRPVEIIIVDDGSTDDTPRVISELAAQHPEIRTTRIPNSGPGGAREAGRLLADGEFIQHLDSDDLIMPQRFELLVAALREHPEAGAAYSKTRYTDLAGRPIAATWKDPNQRQEAMFPSFLAERWWNTPSPLFRRSVIDAAGPWLNLRLEEDWEYDARIAALGTRLAFVDEFLVTVRMHSSSLTRGRMYDPARLRDRATAHTLIYQHARRFGIATEAPEMQHFARELFLLSRQCGAAGLAAESRALFDLSREASGPDGRLLQFRVYALLARTTGWITMGKASAAADWLRTLRNSRS